MTIAATLPAYWTPLNDHITAEQDTDLLALFDDDEERANKYAFTHGSLYFDLSKTHISDSVMEHFERILSESGFKAALKRLFTGDIVNLSENRPALHMALRAKNPIAATVSGEPVAERIKAERDRLYALAEAYRSGDIRADGGARYSHVIFIGIGGSALGPELVLSALASDEAAFDIHTLSNVDAHALQAILVKCDPHATLLVAASKSFTTLETLMNVETALKWMEAGGVMAPKQHLVALTAVPEAAKDFGVKDDNILTFAKWVGGRFSLWSAIGFPIVLAHGTDAFDALLKGAEAMDKHFESVEPRANIPLLAAFMDVYYSVLLGAESRATFPYDQRLSLLPAYLQQVEMESNGKGVTESGEALSWPSAPVLWGGVGTDCQHAVFQLMHQGTHLIPAEFLAVKTPAHGEDVHHKVLLANCFAQSAALMAGRAPDGDGPLDMAKSFSGNRPSTTILLDALTPEALGALLAFYEHRTFAAGTLVGVNVFDQMGVELGKEMALNISKAQNGGEGMEAFDASTQALFKRVFGE